MSKKNLDALKREDPKENNWEITENLECGIRNSESAESAEAVTKTKTVPEKFSGMTLDALKSVAKLEEYTDGASLLGFTAAVLNIVREKVDPEITNNNPVEHWAVADDHCTFVFRNGQKVRVTL